VAVFALSPVDAVYKRSPEDLQAGVVFGAARQTPQVTRSLIGEMTRGCAGVHE